MVYTLPIFNLNVNIWHRIIAASQAYPWGGPVGAPDVATIGQVYYDPKNYMNSSYCYYNSGAGTLTLHGTYNADFLLRLPIGTSINSYDQSITVSNLADCVELAIFPGVYWVVGQVAIAHMGFANEYKVAALCHYYGAFP